MHYEINVTLGKRHFFATHERSLTTAAEAFKVFGIMREKFPVSEGYVVTISYRESTGQDVTAQAIDASNVETFMVNLVNVGL